MQHDAGLRSDLADTGSFEPYNDERATRIRLHGCPFPRKKLVQASCSRGADQDRLRRARIDESRSALVPDHPTTPDHDHVVCGQGHLAHQVTRNENGSSGAGKIAHESADPRDAFRVETVDGFVENEDLRVAEEGRSDAEPLAHPQGEGLRSTLRCGIQANYGKYLVHTPAWDAIRLREAEKVVVPGAAPVERLRVEEGTDLLQRYRKVPIAATVDGHRPLGRAVEADDHSHRRRLPCPVRTEKARHRPRLHVESEVVDGEGSPVAFREVAGLDHLSSISTAIINTRGPNSGRFATAVDRDETAIEVCDLTVRYGRKVAVDSLHLRVASGEIVALLGRNGAGKTSTVETLEGYRAPSAGRVRVLGLDPSDRRSHRALALRMGVMLQKGGVYPGIGAGEALKLFASYYARPLDPQNLLDELDLGGVARTPWRRMSGGEQQRLSLALALIGRPDVAFLDEPTAGVDPHGRLVIREKISSLRGSGAAVVVTTHELEEAEKLADRIVIMDGGRIVAAGRPKDLIASSPSARRVRFNAKDGLDTSPLAELLAAAVYETTPGSYTVALEGDGGASDSRQAVAAITSWLAKLDLPLAGLRVGATLEDVFLDITGQSTGSDQL